MGLATFFGVTVYPSALAGAPHWAQPIVTTPLVLATIAYCDAKGPITLELSFDEFVIGADITYDGKSMEFPAEPPSKDELLDTERGYPRLAGFLVRQHTDRRMPIKGGRALTVRSLKGIQPTSNSRQEHDCDSLTSVCSDTAWPVRPRFSAAHFSARQSRSMRCNPSSKSLLASA